MPDTHDKSSPTSSSQENVYVRLTPPATHSHKHFSETYIWPSAALAQASLQVRSVGRFPTNPSCNILSGKVQAGFKTDVFPFPQHWPSFSFSVIPCHRSASPFISLPLMTTHLFMEKNRLTFEATVR